MESLRTPSLFPLKRKQSKEEIILITYQNSSSYFLFLIATHHIETLRHVRLQSSKAKESKAKQREKENPHIHTSNYPNLFSTHTFKFLFIHIYLPTKQLSLTLCVCYTLYFSRFFFVSRLKFSRHPLPSIFPKRKKPQPPS